MDVGILSTGYYVPENIITNEMVQARLELLSDGPAKGMTRAMLGIKNSRFVGAEETATDIGVKAAQNAIKNAYINKEEIDLIVYHSSTPDHLGSPDGYLVQHMLGIYGAAALTLTSGCSGFIAAIQTGQKFIADGTYRTVLVICAEVVSKACQINEKAEGIEKTGAINVGDAAAAVIIRALKPGQKGILSGDLGGDGRGYEVLMVPAGGMRLPATEENIKKGLTIARINDNNFKYDSNDSSSTSPTVQFAANSFVAGINNVLKRAKLDKEDISWLIPHQPNYELIKIMAGRYGIESPKILMTIEQFACPWSAATPLTLAIENEKSRFKKGDIVVIVAFGGGFAYGAICLSWNDAADFVQ